MLRWAPSKFGSAKPTTPTNKRTTPKILQTVFAIHSLLCEKFGTERRCARLSLRPRFNDHWFRFGAPHVYQRGRRVAKNFTRRGVLSAGCLIPVYICEQFRGD